MRLYEDAQSSSPDRQIPRRIQGQVYLIRRRYRTYTRRPGREYSRSDRCRRLDDLWLNQHRNGISGQGRLGPFDVGLRKIDAEGQSQISRHYPGHDNSFLEALDIEARQRRRSA